MAVKIYYQGSSKILTRICAAINDLIDNGGSGYTLPTASADTLGGVKVGSGLQINSSGVLSTTGGGGGGGSSPLFYDSDGSICIDYDLLEVR